MFVALRRRAFTLIELLIVVAIIAILAAIAVPNFLEAQVRAKVSRAASDMRSLTTAIESYRVDHNTYPEGTDSRAKQPLEAIAFFDPHGLTAGYYTFTSRNDTRIAGIHFATVTTPVAYITQVPKDVFAEQVGGPVTYQYRNAKETKNGWVLTSFGPDVDVLDAGGVGTQNTNPLSTRAESSSPARLGDISERSVIHYIEGTNAGIISGVNTQFGNLERAVGDLSYDPTNGTISDGDLVRFMK